jgi:hypothetical protein
LVRRDHANPVPYESSGFHLYPWPLPGAEQNGISAGGGAVTLLEPDVALTDFGLAIECAGLAGWLHLRSVPGGPLRSSFVIFFAAVGMAALLGGATHGFLSDTQSEIYEVIWTGTLLVIGVAAVSSWAIGGRLLFSASDAKRVLVVAMSLFAIYIATVLAISQSFAVAIVFYLPAAAFLLASFVLTYLRHYKNYLMAGIIGLALSFGAAAIQQSEISISSLGLSHNALYHLIQAAAFLLIFWAARGITTNSPT